MSAHNNVGMKAEAAIVAYLQTKTLGTIPAANIYEGISLGASEADTEESSNPLPNIVVRCDGGDESIPRTGIFALSISIDVESSAEDDAGEHLTNAGEVFNNIVTDSFASDIAATDFTCLGVTFGQQTQTIDGRRWRSSLSLQAHCCGSSL